MRTRIVVFCLFSVIPAVGGTDIQPDPVYRETEVRLARPRLDGEVFDPQETDPTLTSIFASADRKAERAVGNVPRTSQFIIHFWEAKKQILSEEYGIRWQTPAELNPSIKYASYGQPEITDKEERLLRQLVAELLSNRDSESVTAIDRSFEGIASVWTRDHYTQRIREYRFSGHDEHWTFMDFREWER